MPPDMGGQFDKVLKLGAPGDAFDATGPFDWEGCLFMSVFIYQSEGAESAAAAGMCSPTLVDDPDDPGRHRWKLPVKVEVPDPQENGLTRSLVAGPALAVATAVVVSQGAVSVQQWGQAITLE